MDVWGPHFDKRGRILPYHIANPPIEKTSQMSEGLKAKNTCSNMSILMLGSCCDIPGVVGGLMGYLDALL
jgi:hypothetical protein